MSHRSADSVRSSSRARLPLDLQRIYRQLQQSTIREECDGLNLRRASRDYRRQVKAGRHTKSQYMDRSDVRSILETIEHLFQATGIESDHYLVTY